MINKITYSLLSSLFLLFCATINAQGDLKVIDNKGTLKSINKVTYGTLAPTLTNPPLKIRGDMYILGNAINPKETYIFDGGFPGKWVNISSRLNWELKGNSGTNPNNNFIGTTDAQPLVFKTDDKERLQIRAVGNEGQILINQAPTFKDHPLVVRANGVDVLAFQNAAGIPKWHWNLLAGGLNFVESDVADYRLFLKNGGNVGVGTNEPTEKLDVDGKIKIRVVEDITNNGLDSDDKTLIIGSDNVVKKIALPYIVATGNVSVNGVCECSSGVNTQFTATSNTGYYYIDGFGTGKYTIQLTQEAPPTNEWNRQIYYYDKNGSDFKVKIVDRLQGVNDSTTDKRKKGAFSFVITRIP